MRSRLVGDTEFGVPFPGRKVPRDAWTKTGLRDPEAAFDWEAVFGRDAARVVDLGCGNGRYLIGSALDRPEFLHVGIDVVQVVIDHAAQRANRRGVTNARFVVGDAAKWLFERFQEDSLDEVHVYHPQPYYEPGQAGQRLITPEFLERTWTVTRPGGLLVVQTDNKAYWKYLQSAVAKHFEPVEVKGPWPDAPRGRTSREIQARQKGLMVWRVQARRRDVPLSIAIGAPDFDANRPRFRRRGK